jgi:ABC-type bacteriocin/lantibiotic exporter with double-glycine peptidase domain
MNPKTARAITIVIDSLFLVTLIALLFNFELAWLPSIMILAWGLYTSQNLKDLYRWLTKAFQK